MHSICFVGGQESRIVAEIVMNGLRKEAAMMEKLLPLPKQEELQLVTAKSMPISVSTATATATTTATTSALAPPSQSPSPLQSSSTLALASTSMVMSTSVAETVSAAGFVSQSTATETSTATTTSMSTSGVLPALIAMLPTDLKDYKAEKTGLSFQSLRPLMKTPSRFDMVVIVDGNHPAGKPDSSPASVSAVLQRVKDNGYVVASHERLRQDGARLDLFNAVTYGLDQDAAVTLSSIDDTGKLSMTLCLQKAVPSLAGTLIQPFEAQVRTDGEYGDVNLYLAAMACMLVLGIKF